MATKQLRIKKKTRDDGIEPDKPKKKKKNQHKDTPPDDILWPIYMKYRELNLPITKLHQVILEDIDQDQFGLSLKYLRRRLDEWDIQSTYKQGHTIHSIGPHVQKIRARFPTMGARAMVVALREEANIKVSEPIILQYLREAEPDAVQLRKSGASFKRKRFYSAGVMDVLTMDQHDKWKRFGLYLHLGLDPFSGKLHWLKIWWNNHNPRLITSFYLEAGRRNGGVPLITQSDPGTENNGVANTHTRIRHITDQSLSDTLQHRWDPDNLKAEGAWSQLRRRWTPGFEDLLNDGINQGLYDPQDALERLVFRWLAIPWLQQELDVWAARMNRTKRRSDKHKVLPNGPPDLIHSKPHLFETENFTVAVPDEIFDAMEQEMAPRDHPIFNLVPPPFDTHTERLYAAIGHPEVNSDSFWDVYMRLVIAFRSDELYARDVEAAGAGLLLQEETALLEAPEEEVAVIEGLKAVRLGGRHIDNALTTQDSGFMETQENSGVVSEMVLRDQGCDKEDDTFFEDDSDFDPRVYVAFSSDEE